VLTLEHNRATHLTQADDLRHLFRPEAVNNDPGFARCLRGHHLLHAVFAWVWQALNVQVFPQHIIHGFGEIMVAKILDDLQFKYNLPSANFGPRKIERILAYARIGCVMEACFELLGLPTGHAFLDATGYSPFSWEAVREFVAIRLHLDQRHIVYALTALGFQFNEQNLSDVVTVVAMELGVGTRAQPTPLVLYEKDLTGDHKDLVALGLRSAQPFQQQQLPVNGNARPPTVGNGGSNAANSGFREDYSYICQTVKGTDWDFSALLQTKIEDALKVDIRTESIHKLQEIMGKQMVRSPYYTWDATKGKLVERTYTTLDAHGGTITVKPERLIPAYTVREHPSQSPHAKKKEMQIAFSVSFLRQSLLFPIAEGDEKALLDDHGIEIGAFEKKLRTQGLKRRGADESQPKAFEIADLSRHLKKEEREALYMDLAAITTAEETTDQDRFAVQLSLRLSTPPRQRLQLVRREEAQVTDIWCQNLGNVDICVQPMAAAITHVLSTPEFGYGRVLTDPDELHKGEDAVGTQRFLTVYTPPNFDLVVKVPQDRDVFTDEHRIISLHTFLQRLEVTHAPPNGSRKLLIENNCRANHLARQHFVSTAGAAASAGTIEFLSTHYHTIGCDPDLLSALECWKQLGMPDLPHSLTIAREAEIPVETTPWFYHVQLRKIHAYFAAEKGKKTKHDGEAYELNKNYPAKHIKKEIDDQAHMMKQPTRVSSYDRTVLQQSFADTWALLHPAEAENATLEAAAARSVALSRPD
jgi:hypothetical protein